MKTNNLANRLIAHRGEPDNYPENSLAGFKAVLNTDICYVETDVQITNDDVAILSHDPSLKKITGQDLLISEVSYEEIKNLSAAYVSRFGDKYSDYKITTLSMFCDLLAQHQETTCFIEIKKDCIKSHGNKAFDIISPMLKKISKQVVIISFSSDTLKYIRQTCDLPIGWVLPEWNIKNENKAKQLQAEYMFCNRKRLPVDLKKLWQGNWIWAVYTMNTVDDIKYYDTFDIDMFETNQIRLHTQQLRQL